MKGIIHIKLDFLDKHKIGLDDFIYNSKLRIIFFILTPYALFSQNNFWQNIELPAIYQGGFHKIIQDYEGNLYSVGAGNTMSPIDPFILKSTDDGESWFKVKQLTGNLNEFVIDFQNNIYISMVGNGILRSTDGGISWFNLMPGYNAWRMYVNSTGLLLVYFGGYGLFYSDDLAETWNFLSWTPNTLQCISESPNGDYFICDSDSGIYYSTDGCQTWVWRSEGFTARWSHDESTLIFVDDTTIIATNSGYEFAKEVYQSTNYGGTWRKIDLPVYTNSIFGILKDFNGELLLNTKDGGLFKSIDKGSTWALASVLRCNGIIRTNLLSLIAVNEKGIFKNIGNNKIIWRQAETIRIKPGIQSVSESVSGKIYLKLNYNNSSINSGYYKFSYTASNWEKIIFPNQYFILTPAGKIFGTYIFSSGDGGYSDLAYSTNDGATWKKIYFYGGAGTPWWFEALDATDEGVVMISLANRKIVYSTDLGLTWSNSNAAEIENKLIAIKNSQYAYVLRDYHLNLFDLTNNNFTLLQTPFVQQSIEYLRYRPYDLSLYAVCSQGVFKSTNDGNNWIQIVFEKPAKYYFDSKQNLFYSNTAGEIFGSFDSGTNWNKIADKPDSTSIIAISGDTNGFIFTATQVGFYKSTVSVMTNVRMENSNEFAKLNLLQNYPNPFNSNTVFSFYLPDDSNLLLEIYDIIGRKVDEVFCGDLTKGLHRINWGSSNLASGVYTLILRTSKFSRSNSFMIIK